jgi:hypothetical protein
MKPPSQDRHRVYGEIRRLFSFADFEGEEE